MHESDQPDGETDELDTESVEPETDPAACRRAELDELNDAFDTVDAASRRWIRTISTRPKRCCIAGDPSAVTMTTPNPSHPARPDMRRLTHFPESRSWAVCSVVAAVRAVPRLARRCADRLDRARARSAVMARLAACRAADRTWTRPASGSPTTRSAPDGQSSNAARPRMRRRPGYMKGGMMKLGQMASYLDEGMPEPMRCWRAAQRRPFDDRRSRAERNQAGLGRPLHELFEHIDAEPIASASLGCPKARTLDGRDVAVKVQYPGIADAIASDMDNSETLATMLSDDLPGSRPGRIGRGAPLPHQRGARLREQAANVDSSPTTTKATRRSGSPT